MTCELFTPDDPDEEVIQFIDTLLDGEIIGYKQAVELLDYFEIEAQSADDSACA